MIRNFARIILTISILSLSLSIFMLWRRQEPFYTHFYLFIWWSYIGILDSWLYLQGGESLWIERPIDFFTFLVPFSSFVWFIFEAFNLRIQNWHYINIPKEIWVRWSGNFFAFGTVLPGIFVTANLLDYCGLFRKNEFSQFFSTEISKRNFVILVSGGTAMLVLPLIFPGYFFPLLWGGFVLLLDPINALWNGRSLIQEWRQKNFNRTLQLLFAGLICGGFWELWNFWAGAKWIYSVPLPESLLKELKIFEMPILGFLGFPPFALECFVMTEFTRKVKEKVSVQAWNAFIFCSLLFALLMCHLMDIYTIKLFR